MQMSFSSGAWIKEERSRSTPPYYPMRLNWVGDWLKNRVLHTTLFEDKIGKEHGWSLPAASARRHGKMRVNKVVKSSGVMSVAVR
jgi:hypothetical protein